MSDTQSQLKDMPNQVTSPQPHTSAQHTLLSALTRHVYRIPSVGVAFRRFVESRLGKRFYQDRTFWNDSLSGWAAPYLGGTLSIDVRNSITVHLLNQLAPKATSVLDLGCAGASLALSLGANVHTYCGVDISDVAIERARVNLRGSRHSLATLAVAPVQDFQPSQQFDVIVFNEVLYYLSLNETSSAIRHHSRFLSEGGLVVVSLKEDEVSRLVQTVIMKELRFEYSVLYQQQPMEPRWTTTRNRETPPYLVQAFRKTSAH